MFPGLHNYPITRFPDYPISAPYPLPVDPNGPNAYWTSEGCIPMRSNVYRGSVIRPPRKLLCKKDLPGHHFRPNCPLSICPGLPWTANGFLPVLGTAKRGGLVTDKKC